jgi:Polyketide cyclase / dehydrase and lipid transport
MELVRTLDAPVSPDRLFALVDDLAVYPTWMPLVHDVTEVAWPDGGPVWDVELRAKVGPFARSKRLRMRRTERVAPEHAVFERAEVDGRAHSPWVLRAAVAPTADGASTSRLTMSLRYGGSLWTGAALQRVLDHEVDRGRTNLLALLSSEPTR